QQFHQGKAALRHDAAFLDVIGVLQVPVADVGIGAGAPGPAIGTEAVEVECAIVAARPQVLVSIAPGVTLQTVDVAAVTPVARRVAAGPLHQGAEPLFGGRVVEVVQPVEIQRTLHGADIVLHLGDTGLVRPVHHPRHHHRGKDAENDHHHHDLDQGETTLGKGSCLYALHNQLTSWLSSKMGSRMASTMTSTTPPIARISRGSKTPMTMAIRASSSRSWVSAARSSILSSVPLLSPLLIRLSVMGGK